MQNKLLFSLDIGTRSVIGIVAEQIDHKMRIMATERREHMTRAMLDGQIHDVPEVTAVIDDVKAALEKKVGPLNSAAVAAAGRALYTITTTVEQAVSGVLTVESERSLEFSAIQAAQQQLATSNTVADPTLYYCVGYSTVEFRLDDTQLKTLVGQRGKIASAKVIATFLPRQVIDSMQTALANAGLEMSALTLEPIAAIQVLIPPTMRHLNLVLVDIGAGTSDIAVTNNGSIIAYGMVPLAGDEITEAISQKYLLDFNIAEQIKRKLVPLSKNRKIVFHDILGLEYKLAAKEIIDNIYGCIVELGQAIAAQIMKLNCGSPQAVLLVGGGSLTPFLPDIISEALDIPKMRVAVRSPETIADIPQIPAALKTPDSVTPLGILKISASQSLNFLTLTVNDKELRMFNFSKLTLGDALLAAGIQIKSLGGKPGMAITVKINGKAKFIAGTMGKQAKITLNNEVAPLTALIKNGDVITTTTGSDGQPPKVRAADLGNDIIKIPAGYDITINGDTYTVAPAIVINDKPAEPSQIIKDGDSITWRDVKTLGEALLNAGFKPTAHKISFTINGDKSSHTVAPSIMLNGHDATLSDAVKAGDSITFTEPAAPPLSKIIGMDKDAVTMYVHFNKKKCFIPTSQYTFTINGVPAKLSDPVPDNSEIKYAVQETSSILVSDVLLAAKYQPPSSSNRVKFAILLNGQPAEFITPVKLGDDIEIILTPLD